MAEGHAFVHGEEFLQGGCVSKVINDGDSYYASVYGHRRYSVRIRHRGEKLRTSCTCHYGSGKVCRHIVGVMLAVVRRSDEQQQAFNWYEEGQPRNHEVVGADVFQITADLDSETSETVQPSEVDSLTESKSALARDLMSSPVTTLTPDADILEAWKLVSERRFRHVPIVSADGRIQGIVSDRDILLRAALIAAADAQKSAAPGGTVGQIMHAPVLTSSPSTAVRQIARVLFEERVGAMPIVDESGQLVGMITRSDILRALVRNELVIL